MSTLALHGLRKVFDDGTIAVAGVDLEMADGEFLAIVGPSGCGKTTVLRMVAGLEEPTGGEIRIDDEVVTHHSAQQRDIAPYAHCTARGGGRRIPTGSVGRLCSFNMFSFIVGASARFALSGFEGSITRSAMGASISEARYRA